MSKQKLLGLGLLAFGVGYWLSPWHVPTKPVSYPAQPTPVVEEGCPYHHVPLRLETEYRYVK